MKSDFFISHSRETKFTIAVPIVQKLSEWGFNIWIDRKELTVGETIYHTIKEAIRDTLYGIVIIDSTYLNRTWTIEELQLFNEREKRENRNIILPIYVCLDKSEVYDSISWLEGRAFEKLTSNNFNTKENIEIICRIVGRYYSEHKKEPVIDSVYRGLDNYDFPCKETLMALFNGRLYFSSDLRLAIIELCNIGGLLYAIYKDISLSPNHILETAFSFCEDLRELCFYANHQLTYNIYIAAFNAIAAASEQLKILLDTR